MTVYSFLSEEARLFLTSALLAFSSLTRLARS